MISRISFPRLLPALGRPILSVVAIPFRLDWGPHQDSGSRMHSILRPTSIPCQYFLFFHRTGLFKSLHHMVQRNFARPVKWGARVVGGRGELHHDEAKKKQPLLKQRALS